MIGANLAVADRLAPTRFPANVHPYVERFHEVFGRRLRLYRYLVGRPARLRPRRADHRAVAVVVAVPQPPELRRRRRQFGVDVGFYVFELPFLSFLLDWLFIATIVVLFVTLITHLLNGGVVFASPVPSVSQGTRGHVAVLLAVLAALKAADYWVQRYETDQRAARLRAGRHLRRGPRPAPGAGVADVGGHRSRRACSCRRCARIVAAARRGVGAVAGAGRARRYVYPAVVQSLVVKPNQASREAPYIERNVDATRAAMGVDELATVKVDFTPLRGRAT